MGTVEKFLMKRDGWECPYFHRTMQFFLSVHVDDMMMAGTTRNMPMMWANLPNNVGLEDPTSLFDRENLGCTQRAAQVNTRIVMEEQKLFSKLISTSTDVKTEETNPKNITACSYDMEGHAQKCVDRCGELAHKKVDQLHQVSKTCLDDHQVEPVDMEIVGDLSGTPSQFALKCGYFDSSGRPDSFWTVNCLARSVTKWKRSYYL